MPTPPPPPPAAPSSSLAAAAAAAPNPTSTSTSTSDSQPPPPSSPSSTAIPVAASSSSSSTSHPYEKRIEQAEAQLTALRAQHDRLLSQLQDGDGGAAHQTVRRHIRLLHAYNEIRDVGLGLMGLIADRRGQRLAEVLREFGVEGAD
ncbi:MAG: hypothetical protein M1816_002121 [Peltula sp. TS41687]|nr:MAG: hypothetical protein M1816_002121 [Peltula sp. TS41687]